MVSERSAGSTSSRPPLKTSNTEAVIRGRPKKPPSSWIRSSSTSKVLGKKKTTELPSHEGQPPMHRPESNNSNMLVDVLPSFEMYNTLHRHIPQGNVDPDRHDFPPSYQEVQTQGNPMSPRPDLSDLPGLDHINDIMTTPTNQLGLSVPSNSYSSLNVNNLHPLSTQHLNIHQTRSTVIDEIPIEDDLNDSDNIFIDKLYTLPKLTTPVEIDIRITKHASQPHEKPEEESILKEYTSGDIIHGYCIIENRSTQPLKFEMFYVTLEAYTSVIDRQKGKRTVKRFLRMVDLSASWSYSNMILSSGINVVAGDVDYDKSIIGLNNNRVLEPGKKYKKFFMFKLPSQLLDITCKQEQFSHCLLPPSFGIDKYRNNGRYSGIKVNSVLGCGHLGIKGSPILTYDMIDDNLSINYTVDARIVGKDAKSHKLNIMKEQVYNIRVIPFGFSSSQPGDKKPTAQLKELISLVKDRIKALERVFNRLEKKEHILNSDIHSTDISGTVENNLDLSSEEILNHKIRHMYIKNNANSNQAALNPSKDLRTLYPKDDIIEGELNYRIKNKKNSSANLTSGLFSGLLGSPSSSSTSLSSSLATELHSSKNESVLSSKLDKLGLIVLTCKVPRISLAYQSPSLLRKTNVFDSKNEHDQENWQKLVNFVPEQERQQLSKLDIHLTCMQSNNSAKHEPPEIHSITTELICITARSDNSIPIRLEPETLMNEEKLKGLTSKFTAYQNIVKEYRKKFNENIVELNELYNSMRTFSTDLELKFTDFVSSQIYNDIESLANLEVNVVHINEIFKKQIHTLKARNDAITATHSTSGSSHSLSSTMSANTIKLATSFSAAPSIGTPKSSTSTKFKEQIAHSWEKTNELQYERDVNVNLEYCPEIRETLVPSFESCLCCRSYCIRVSIKFENHIGVATIDVPVTVKKAIM